MPDSKISQWCYQVLERSNVIPDRKRCILFFKSKYNGKCSMSSNFGIINETVKSGIEI